ncbi:MAG: acetylxylan esterase [Prevotella sp.]|nr:acetylxylan esterase [Candidatus Prevotella equi]
MRKLFLLITLLAAIGIKAENYPTRSDYLWVTVPDHNDWLYKTNEKATVDVQLYKYGVPQNVEVKYEISPDMLPATSNGTIVLKNGKGSISMGTRKTPGFTDLKLTATIDGQSTSHHIKVGYGVDKITPYTKEPKDFMDFWQNEIAEMRKTPLAFSVEAAHEYDTKKADCYLLRLEVNKQHQCIYAYYWLPRDNKKGPIVLCPPGAGVKTIKEPLRHSYYADNGCIRMEMEIHGLDPRISDNQFKEISNALSTGANGYLTNGLDSREHYYMRRVYLSLVRCIDYLTSLPQWDGKNVVLQGGSQGGALSIIAAALDSRVTLCVANHPALADMAGYAEDGRTGGYPHMHKTGHLTPQFIKTLEYYDVVNFARHITCPVRMTWGYNDSTCPPTTSYAVWNVLTCPKESLITPINEHWTSEQTEKSHCDWIMKRIK